LTWRTHPRTIIVVRQRLQGPLEVAIPTRLSLADASGRLRRSLADRSSIETNTDSPSDRRLAGTVSEARADLSISDAHLIIRRRSWNVEFHGAFNPTGDGATLQGMIDIPDRRALHRIMWLFRIGAGMMVVLALSVTGRDSAQGAQVAVWPVIFAIVLAAATFMITALMEVEGEREAAKDAERLVEFLRQTLT
jgi:hypothetical protein